MGTITISAAADGPYRLSWDVERAVSIETSLSSMNLILDGHTWTPLEVTVLNDRGAIDAGDDTTLVSVTVVDGNAKIIPQVGMVSNGRATFQIRPHAVGELRLSIEVGGVPPLLRTFNIAPGVSLDLGSGPQDDGVRTLQVSHDEDVPVEIHYSGGLETLKGIELHLDIGSLEFVRFDPGPAIVGSETLIGRDGPRLVLSAVALGGTLPLEGGLVGRVYLRTTSDAEVPVSVLSASLGEQKGIRSLEVGDAARVRLQIEQKPVTWQGFQVQFCRTRGERGFDFRYDLNVDGIVGFQDFLLFAHTQ
jgi:hypothetical protein